MRQKFRRAIIYLRHTKERFAMEKLDKTDLIILDILQRNARTSIKDIAKEAFLSSPAVSARIEKLEKFGYVRSFHAEIDNVKLGFYVKAFIDVAIPPEKKAEFCKFIEKCANVQECCSVTGEYSMHIKTAFRTTQELDAFVTKLQRYGHTKTQIVFSTVVEPRGIPLE